MSVYLDYAASSPLSKSLKGKLDELNAMWYNPSSYYQAGAYNKYVIENARKKIAKLINAEPEEIIFTSSGSEANALAIDGFLKENTEFKECICSNIEHASILKNPNCKPLLKCNEEGVVTEDTIIYKEKFYSIMMCNNEIGTYQPIKEISNKVHSLNGFLHVDAVQAFGKIPIDVKAIDVDMMSISGHKIGSLRGVGVLYVKKGIKLSPIIYGEQENALRGGTYNDLAIKSFNIALDDIDFDKDSILRSKRDYLLRLLLENKNIHLNGGLDTRNSTNINIRISGMSIDGQQLVGLLDEAGFQVSAGSACHSYNNEPSHVLKAIGLTDEQANHSIRITIGEDTSTSDLIEFYEKLMSIIEMFKKK